MTLKTAAIPLGLVAYLALVLDANPALAQLAPVIDAAPTAIGSEQTILLVNPTVGNDAAADGSEQSPFKTITRALEAAKANTVIQLSAGTYSAETGETFPLRLKPGVTIQGNAQTRGSGIVIQGGGLFISPTFARQNITILGMNQAAVVGVTIVNPSPRGYGIWVESTSPTVTDSTFTESGHDGISVVGNSAPLIRNNYFYKNGANGITIYGKSRPEVRENIFEQTGFGININQKATPRIIGNRVTGNVDGIVVQASAQPILRNNSVESNQRDGLVAIAQAQPDLGTATEPGGNFFLNNGQFDVNGKATSQVIPALGNEIKKTIGNLSLTGTATPSESSEASNAAQPEPTAVAVSGPPRAAVPVVAALPTQSVSPPATIVPPQPVTASVTVAPIRSNVEASRPATSSPAAISAASFPTPTALKQSSPNSGTRVTPPVVSSPGEVKTEVEAIDRPPPAAKPTTKPAAKPAAKPIQVAQSHGFTARTAGPPQLPRIPSLSSRRDVAATASRTASREVSRAAQRDRNSQPAQTVKPAAAGSLSFKIPTPTAPIDIPVPPPESASTAASAPDKLLKQEESPPVSESTARVAIASQIPEEVIAPRVSEPSRVASPAAVVTIPVPPPESVSVASAPAPQVASNAKARLPASAPKLDLLPVPGTAAAAPIGNVGDTPTAEIYQAASSRTGTSASVETAVAQLRYRVVVNAESDQQQEEIRAVVPDAFWTSINGRLVMQVGAFGDRSNASEMVETLVSRGLNATIEQRE